MTHEDFLPRWSKENQCFEEEKVEVVSPTCAKP